MIYELVDAVMSQRQGNFVKGFESLEDITAWLRGQFSGLFATLLREQSSRREIQDLGAQIGELRAVVESLKSYSEEIMKSVNMVSQEVIERVESNLAREKLLAELRLRSPFWAYVEKYAPRTSPPIDLVSLFVGAESLDEFLGTLVEHAFPSKVVERIRERREKAEGDLRRAKDLIAGVETAVDDTN